MKKNKVMILLMCCGFLGAFLYFHVNKGQEPPTVQAETVEDEAGTEEANSPFEVPKTYQKELPGSSLSFDAEVIVPENFDGNNVYMGTAEQMLDREKIRSMLFGNVELKQDKWNDALNAWGERETGETDEDSDGNFMRLEGNDYLYFESLEGGYIDNCVRVDTIEENNNVDI